MGSKASSAPETFHFDDDGSIPNNPALAFVVFRAIDLHGSADPEAAIEETFERHGWGGLWRNGVYPFVHYHSRIHEAMGVARGHAKVRFGGDNGVEVELNAGDVAVLPAGTGHQRIARTSSSSALIRRPGVTISVAAARMNTRRRSSPFTAFRCRRPTRFSARTAP